MFQVEIMDGNGHVWHKPFSYGNLTFRETHCGCGFMQVYGLAMISPEKLKNYKENWQSVLDHLKERYKGDDKFDYLNQMGIGMVIGTLGQNYRARYESSIKELGFKKLAEYNNWRHMDGGNGKVEKQTLYGLELV